jgi:class 3 adenylate cyclase
MPPVTILNPDPPAPALAPAQILVVDDIFANRDLIARRVEKEGHVVTMAENGREAMEKLRQKPFDLVLLDIQMPEMNGYQVLEQAKADPALRHIPVVVISAVNEIDSVARCIQLGAEDYLFKPFNAVLLKARVAASLENKRLRDRERQVLAELRAEREKTESLLHSIFPKAIVARLKSGRSTGSAGSAGIADSVPTATILWADIANFAELSAGKGPTVVVGLLNLVFTAFDALCDRHGVEKIKTVGDAFIAAGGVPEPRPDHAEAVADLALAMQQEVVRLNTGLRDPFSLKIGMDSGPVVAGVIGTTKFAYDVWGKAVDTAAQMETYGLPGGIQVTANVFNRLKDKYILESRGEFYVQGEGEVETYLLRGRRLGLNERDSRPRPA